MRLRCFTLLVLVGLALLPRPALGQGVVSGPDLIQGFTEHGSYAGTLVRAGSLAFVVVVEGPFSFSTLWRSDGTPDGTFQLDPPGSIDPKGTILVQDTLDHRVFFTWAQGSGSADSDLWRSDGTSAGMIPLTEGLSLGAGLAVPEKGLFFFSAGARPGSPDQELWATDGTQDGTRLVKELNPEGASNPRSMVAFDGRLLFLADTPAPALWSSDGTPQGTVPVKGFESGTARLVEADGALFVLETTPGSVALWRSDGSEAGTTKVLEIPSRRLTTYTAAGRHLFLTVEDANGLNGEMWVADSVTGEAVRVLQLAAKGPTSMLASGDSILFSLTDENGTEPWWSDGTPEGTQRVSDVCPGPCSSFPELVGTYGGRALFTALGSDGRELRSTDGNGTRWLANLCCGSGFVQAYVVNGWLVFVSDSQNLWVSDGTGDGTFRIANLDPAGVVAGVALPDRFVFSTVEPGSIGKLFSMTLTAPPTPPGEWLTSSRVSGFRFKVRIAGQVQGSQEPDCIPETLCVSGALAGRTEVLLRVVGPRPNGYLWPTIVRFTTSTVEVWIEQAKTGTIRYYTLETPPRDSSDLSGSVDRQGFRP